MTCFIFPEYYCKNRKTGFHGRARSERCNHFILCTSKATYRMKCNDDLRWSRDSQQCEPEDMVSCTAHPFSVASDQGTSLIVYCVRSRHFTHSLLHQITWYFTHCLLDQIRAFPPHSQLHQITVFHPLSIRSDQCISPIIYCITSKYFNHSLLYRIKVLYPISITPV